MEQASARRDLAELDDRMLADIGVSRGEAMQEAARSFLDRAPLPVDPSRMRPPPGGAACGEVGPMRHAWTSLFREGRPSG